MWMQKQKLAHMPPINRADVKNWVFGEPIHTLFSLNILHRYYYYLWKEYYLCQRANYCLLADGFFLTKLEQCHSTSQLQFGHEKNIIIV